ncbi:MAG: hypothetical protein OXB86_04700 [Bdellovibrionales bacterium]|nr:hypothetical protein [Bdellovibrionales bacterium]
MSFTILIICFKISAVPENQNRFDILEKDTMNLNHPKMIDDTLIPETSLQSIEDTLSKIPKEQHSKTSLPSEASIPLQNKNYTVPSSVSFSGKNDRILILSPGETTRLPLPNSYRVYVGQKHLLFLHSKNGFLIISGKKEGQTFIRLNNKIHPVLIVKKELKQHILLIDQLLKTLWGLEWSLDQSQIKITGQLNRLYDWVKLSEKARQNNIPYLFHASLGEGLKESAESFFRQLFHSRKKTPPYIQWQNLPLVFIPQGSKEIEKFYQKTLKPFGFILKTDPVWFTPATSIQIEIAFLEITKNTSLAFGNQSPSSLLDLLNLLLSRGKGRLLHHSSITAQNERETTIHSGGQIPFTQYNLETRRQNTRWKSHGLLLKMTPKWNKKKTLRLQIRGEISSPFGSHPPSLKTQTFSGIFDVKEGQILKLLHLKKQSKGNSLNGGLSLLPFSAQMNQQNYKMSQIILLRASLYKEQQKNQYKGR